VSYDTLTYKGAVMDGGGEVIERESFAHDRRFRALRWTRKMRLRYGGRIIDHNAHSKVRLASASTMKRKQRPGFCCSDSEKASGCGTGSAPDPGGPPDDDFAAKVHDVLEDQHAVVSFEERSRLIAWLSKSVRQRKVVVYQWSNNRKEDDVIGLIQLSREAGDLDEAVWRSFLAAHFGRASADEGQRHTASDFLCGFGGEPYWTWERVCQSMNPLWAWLSSHAADLQSLSYGNHRKFESKQPGDVFEVIRSFVTVAKEHGGPAKLVTVDAGGAALRFDLLYRRLSRLWRFRRTGCFDFLALMIDLGLVSAEPGSCYLRGATGPLKGAKRLWGPRHIGELEDLAADLAERLDVSPMAVEDALCNWKK